MAAKIDKIVISELAATDLMAWNIFGRVENYKKISRPPNFKVPLRPLEKDRCDQSNPPNVNCAAFTHSVRMRANALKFSHQSLCNPTISSLMKALKKGFLKGCPDLSEELVTKYLNPSPATAKGHMKRPKKEFEARRRNPSEH